MVARSLIDYNTLGKNIAEWDNCAVQRRGSARDYLVLDPAIQLRLGIYAGNIHFLRRI